MTINLSSIRILLNPTVAVFLIAFLIRFLYAITIEIDNPIRGDAAFYVQYANNLIQHGTFSKSFNTPPIPDSFWSPGYPVFLSICMLIASTLHIDEYFFVLSSQALLGGLTATITYAVGKRLLPRGPAIAAATLTTLSPHLISLGSYLLTESLASLLLISAIYFYSKADASAEKTANIICSGTIFGFTYLTNPVFGAVPFVMVLMRTIQCMRVSRAIRYFRFPLIFIAPFLSIVIAWSIREAISLPTNSESSVDRAFANLVYGSYADFHDLWRANPRDPENPAAKDLSIFKTNHRGFFLELVDRISHDPLHYSKWYFLEKPIELWGWNIVIGQGDIFVYPVISSLFHTSRIALAALVIMKSLHFWLFAAAVIGGIYALKERDSARKEVVTTLYSCLICVSGIYIILQTDGRYSIPMRPEMYLCAVYGINKIYSQIKLRSKVDRKFS